MGFDNECIINIQSLKGEYFCPVCRLLVYPNEALQSQCSHLYCKPCLTYIVRTTQACPYDGYLVTEADSKPLIQSNKVLADTIGKISVNCLFHRSGCTWQGQLADCTSHCSGCPFGDSSVMCNRCGVQIVHRQVEEHAQNCPVVQSQAPQPDNGQVASGTALNAPSNQNHTVAAAAAAAASTPASQAQVASATSVAVQKSAQQVNPASQPQTAQAAMPNTEQWYQQQQQYQQYYQQYPGYDPYQQQQYQPYYPYQQQAVQQFQQPVQVYSSQAPGQQQALPSHTTQQAQQISHAPPHNVQPQSHPPQAASNIQQQIQPAGQPQTLQNQAAYSVPQSQPPSYPQIQPYAHPQTGTQTVPQQGMQMPPYQQTRPQMQPSHPQVQTQPYPQQQAQQYSHPQSHLPAQTQTHPHSNSHTTTLPPPHPTQTMNHAGPLQAQNVPAQAVTGYQSYQQAQPLQKTQVGAPHSLHMNGLSQQPSNPSQFQGQFPQQPAQVRPSHVPAMMPNQQPTMVPPQVQNTGASVAQLPIYPHSKHPGYPYQHQSSMQPVQHASAQPQGFLGHSPYVQQHPAMQAPVRVQAQGQTYQQNSTHASVQHNIRPMISHGGVQQLYSQAPGLTNATQPSTNQPSVNQSYPSVPIHGQELKPSIADMPGAHNMEKVKLEQNNAQHGSGNLAGVGTTELSNTEPKPSVGPDAKSDVYENGTPQKENLKIKEGALDNATELPSASKSSDVNEDGKENEKLSDKGFSASALPPVSSLSIAKQVHGSHSVPSSDPGRNQLPSAHPGPSPQHRLVGPLMTQSVPEPGASHFLGQPPGQLRPQVPAKMHPSHSAYSDNPSGPMFGSSAVAPYGRGSGSGGLPQGHFNQGKFPGGPPFVSPPTGPRGGIIGGVRPDFPEGSINKPRPPNPMEGPGGFSDGRHPELRSHGPMEQRPFGQAPSFHRLQDERINMPPEEHLKPFPSEHSFGRRDFEGDLQKFPRPSHLDGGTPGKFGPRFPPPAPHDQGPHMFGDRLKPSGFRDVNLGRPGYPDFPRPVTGFDHHGSPGRDFRAVPTSGVGGFPHDIDVNESHSYPRGKAFQESRFPGLAGHLQRGEFDGPINIHGSDHMIGGPRKHSRVGDAIGQDMLPIHSRRGDFGPHNVLSREATGPGAFRGHLEMGEPPFPGSYLPPRPFGEPFGREMPGYPHVGEPGFRGSYNMRYAHDDGFYRGEREPFDNPRKRKPGTVMCRICNVDCETLEGLDMHSQTREHQNKAMDMVMSIKQQNSKKQKVSNRSVLEEGRKNRTASFEGQGKKH